MPFTLRDEDRVEVDAELTALLAEFQVSDPRLDIWRRLPDVTEAEDVLTDRWACDAASRLLVAFLSARGVDAVLVHAEDSEHPMADYHYWARVRRPGGDVDVDWTARQFHNLGYPSTPEHQAIPCPLLWRANGRHPVVGAFGRVSETG